MIRFIFAIWLALGAGALLVGQEQELQKQRPGQLTVESIVELVEAGLGEDVIIEKLRQNATAFDLSVDQLLQLKTAGVSAQIIKTMLNPTDTPTPAPGGANTSDEDPNWPAQIPKELGIYANMDGKITQLEPEISKWKTGGGFLRTITGNYVNGIVRGLQSSYRVSIPFEVYIVVPEGRSANEYQCVSMQQKKQQRMFRILVTSVFKTGSADKNFVFFKAEKIASRLYRIELNQLEPGEYGFIPPDTATAARGGGDGTIYSFGVE